LLTEAARRFMRRLRSVRILRASTHEIAIVTELVTAVQGANAGPLRFGASTW
jgi:hypothetical protein